MDELITKAGCGFDAGDIITIEGIREPVFDNFFGRLLMKVGIDKGLRKHTVSGVFESSGVSIISLGE